MTITASNDNALAPSVSQAKRGFTLTEIAIVLGIIGLILGAIWVAAAAVYNNLRISHADREILQIAQGVRALYATTNNDAGLTTDSLICAKAVPSDMVTAAGCAGAGTLNDPWPTGVTTVTPTTDNLGFVITMTQVPQSACINLLMNVASSSKDPSLFVAQGGAYTVAATGAPLAVVASPALAIATAAGGFGGCNAATQNVNFGFGFKT